jgi:putative hydrolase of HD superfamily
MKNPILSILRLLKIAEKLKEELRHSWTSNGRHESVAEHTFRVSLMVILCAPYLDREINIEKALKMAIIHDIVEAKIGDTPFFKIPIGSFKEIKKKLLEEKAIKEIKASLNEELGTLIYNLFKEFEECKTYEAKFVKALDKMEANIQHNEADISTWVEEDILHVMNYLDRFCDFDSFLKSFKEEIRKESIEKIKSSNFFDLDKIEKKFPEKISFFQKYFKGKKCLKQ